MTRQIVQLAVALAATVSVGCATCRYPICDIDHPRDDCPEVTAAQRNRVHIFLVNGADVLDMGGVSKLRDRLNEAGYSQGYYGYAYNCFFFTKEMRRIASEDPQARFVVIGYEVGCSSAVSLAAEGRRYGLPVDAAVLLDPAFVGPDTMADLDAPVHVIRSNVWPLRELPKADTAVLADSGHFAVPTAVPTVNQIVCLLRAAAGRVPDDAGGQLVLPLLDDPPPPPEVIPDRGAAPAVPAGELIRQATPAVTTSWSPTAPGAMAGRAKPKP